MKVFRHPTISEIVIFGFFKDIGHEPFFLHTSINLLVDSITFSITTMKLNVASMMKFLRSKTALGLLTASAMYMMAANYNSAESAHMLAAHEPYRRELRTLDLGDGQCEVDLLEDGMPTPPNAVRTLLTSYPGSGKRFTWMVIKALTNQEIAGDWDFTGNLDKNPLTVKTSWPHHEGNWNWGTQMDQVLLLVRSPRWAIPSYQ